MFRISGFGSFAGLTMVLVLATCTTTTKTTMARPQATSPTSALALHATPAQCPPLAPKDELRTDSWSAAHQQLAPPGAAVLRLCRYSGLNGSKPLGHLLGSRLITSPTLIADISDEMDALKPFPKSINCSSDDGSLILALLAYPGHQLTVEVDRSGCQGVSNGDVTRIANGYQTPAEPELERQLNALLASRVPA